MADSDGGNPRESGSEREIYERDGVRATLYRPLGTDPAAVAVLAHGAGGNRDSSIMVALGTELSDRGWLVACIDLPYRQRRPKGPPSPSGAAADRAGIVAAVAAMRQESDAPLILGGQSYGGRQASMVVAEDPALAHGLLCTSYPLHPPGKPERARVDHLPKISRPTVVVHGERDQFATTDEITEAMTLIDAPTRLVEVSGTGHDLRPERTGAASLAADAAEDLFGLRR